MDTLKIGDKVVVSSRNGSKLALCVVTKINKSSVALGVNHRAFSKNTGNERGTDGVFIMRGSNGLALKNDDAEDRVNKHILTRRLNEFQLAVKTQATKDARWGGLRYSDEALENYEKIAKLLGLDI